MEYTVCTLLAELAAPPILVFPDWDVVIDTSRPFRLHCDASTAGLGATLEQEQPDGSIRPIVYISRVTLDNKQNWTPMELEAGCVVWSIRRLRRYLFGVYFLVFTDHQCLQQICKIGETKPRISAGWNFTRPITSVSHIDEDKRTLTPTSSPACPSLLLPTISLPPPPCRTQTILAFISSTRADSPPLPVPSLAWAWVGWSPNRISQFWVGPRRIFRSWVGYP